MTLCRYFATCARGLEAAVMQELKLLGAGGVDEARGGVHFTGDKELLYKANLYLRTAVRVLCPVLETEVRSPEELYEAVRSVDWSRYLTPEHTLAVDCNVRDSAITHSHYAALKTKDAICDQFVDRCGRRPSVDTDRPLVALNLHIYRDRAVLSLDSSLESLHKRGYRPILTKAPLNEALAAGILMYSGWQPNRSFVDLMCGSGTLPIEACWLSINRPPGLTRRRFGFQGWMDFDVELWMAVRDAARRSVLSELKSPILGSDIRADAISWAQKNARAAGVGHLIKLHRCDLRDLKLPDGEPGAIVCNPPYGERIGTEKDLIELYKTLGGHLRTRCQGWRAAIFTGNARLVPYLGMDPVQTIPLYNGKIPCRLLLFDLV